MLPGKKYTPEEILRILWKGKWLLVLPLVTVSSLTVAATNRLPNRYRAETLILVVPQRVPESYVRSTVTSRIEDRLLTINSVILSGSRLETIIREFDLYPEERRLRPIDDVIGLMRSDIQPKVERGDAFRISYISRDPRLAQKVTDRLASLYINENERDREVMAEGTNDFLNAQLEDAKRRLIEHEKRLEEYRRRYSGQLPTQVTTNLQALQNAQMQLQSLAESINRDREKRLMVDRQLADLADVDTAAAAVPLPVASGSGSADTIPVGSTAQQLEVATRNLQELALRYKPGHPDVDKMQRVIRDLEAKLLAERANPRRDSEPSRPISTAQILRDNRIGELKAELENIDRQLDHKSREEGRLKAEIASYQAKVDAAPARETELVELTRDYTTLQGIYTSLFGKLYDAKLSSSLERRQIGERFKVLDPARVPERPFSPDRVRMNLMGALAGLAIGLGLIALLEYRDSTLKSEEDVVRVLSLPVLALVPIMFSEEEVRALRRRRVVASLAGLFAVLGSAAGFALWKLQL